jgi:hypothetical protein
VAALREGQHVADAHGVMRLLDRQTIDADLAGRAQRRGQAAALEEPREEQPLVDAQRRPGVVDTRRHVTRFA